jgi:hypothetical protein
MALINADIVGAALASHQNTKPSINTPDHFAWRPYREPFNTVKSTGPLKYTKTFEWVVIKRSIEENELKERSVTSCTLIKEVFLKKGKVPFQAQTVNISMIGVPVFRYPEAMDKREIVSEELLSQQ